MKNIYHKDSLIVRKNKSNQFKAIPRIKTEVKEEYEIKISNSTIQRRLREAGLFGPKPTTYLSQTS